MNPAHSLWHRVVWGACLGLLLFAAWLAYRPGLSGDFLFDDFANLPVLGAYGPVDNPTTLGRYLTAGTADPTGRPLALASFLIDANDWPADPSAFKRTNILLHLLNGTLLAWVLLCLGRALPLPEPLARNAALLGAGLWLLHPLLVSTTLYVVQREAMLPATFTMLGLLGWIAGRAALRKGHVLRGLLGMLAAVAGGTLLATLGKGNGILLPLLLLLCEWLLLAPSAPMPTVALERVHHRTVWLLLKLPSLLLGVWLLWQIPSALRTAPEMRDWTAWQRLLSEPRALVDYLGLLFVPGAISSGLFNDAFVASTGLLHPWTTLPSLLIVGGLIGVGFGSRHRHPAMAAALLFYFAGHLLESTILPLELYFEHRNYLPAMLLFWPLAIWLLRPGTLATVRRAAALSIVLMLWTLTFMRASQWSDSYRQALDWADQTPDSARAQTNAALYEMAHGRPFIAAARLRRVLPEHPSDPQIALTLVNAECQRGAVSTAALDAVRSSLVRTRIGAQVVFQWFDDAIGIARDHTCSGLDFASVRSLLDAVHNNRSWQALPGRRQDLNHLNGVLALAMRQPEQALQAFDQALAEQPGPAVALGQAATLGSQGYPQQGLAHLDFFATLPISNDAHSGMSGLHAWLLQRQHYWQHETDHLRKALHTAASTPPVAVFSPHK